MNKKSTMNSAAKKLTTQDSEDENNPFKHFKRTKSFKLTKPSLFKAIIGKNILIYKYKYWHELFITIIISFKL